MPKGPRLNTLQLSHIACVPRCCSTGPSQDMVARCHHGVHNSRSIFTSELLYDQCCIHLAVVGVQEVDILEADHNLEKDVAIMFEA
eukprot:6341674-Amphidinium_carterae.1